MVKGIYFAKYFKLLTKHNAEQSQFGRLYDAPTCVQEQHCLKQKKKKKKKTM